MLTALVPASPAAAQSEFQVGARPEEGEVFRLYRAVLGRDPDSAGFGYWAALRVEGVSLRVIADSFLVGEEFRLRFDADTDEEFVDLVYASVFDRPGDPAGVDYWLRELQQGLSRAELILLFSESAEFRIVTDTATESDELPPFRVAVSTPSAAELGASWMPGCPVEPDDLRSLELDHLDFDGNHQRGVIVVHSDVVEEVETVFAELYRSRYPIASLRSIEEFDADDDASMAANNSSAFNCRRITGGQSWSRHAYGRAIDLNPIQNPYVAGDTVLPPAGVSYLDRHHYHQAMIRPGDVVTGAFASNGWRWGGDFRSLADYQHFER